MNVKFIESLSNAYGAPGFEDDVNAVIRDYVKDQFDIQEDTMRNLILMRKNHDGDKPILMLDGHSDEVAFIVQSIRPNGTLRFVPNGSWSAQNVAAHKVRIRNAEGVYIEGVVASKPPHFSSGPEMLIPISEMLIDVGASSYEEVVNDYKIEIGAPIVPDVTFSYNEDRGIMLGKAFDNRLGCGCVVEVLKAIEGMDLAIDVVGAISTQEEVGGRGAKVNAQMIEPDIAIVFEGTPADDTFRDVYDAQGALKKGTQIRHVDKSMISNPRFVSLAKEIAKVHEIPFQEAVRIGGGTNGALIQTQVLDVPCIVLGTPVRYAHTHYGFSAIDDYKASIDLAVEMIKKLSKDVINGF
ncbi:M42 family metallopeptidase [Fusibacter ferrireducens]|uniref:M20/M25/M40 family metallo-hydrolase n=1 Tax=Fusibacter ferrireducens TaxID=2785058 RepID=A0ABR9ZS72_9FIRM|nr:M20/M25/M40 family metallo-hydrolase [Fusibacter ferrireducens]MBF4693302.1 M20/M25/M40 family metallo-hydrolase [Fusibacter ferrireducens]